MTTATKAGNGAKKMTTLGELPVPSAFRAPTGEVAIKTAKVFANRPGKHPVCILWTTGEECRFESGPGMEVEQLAVKFTAAG